MIHNGNSLEVLKQFEENSIDACVCDPPYELGFMGKSWDATGIAYNVDLWREVLRVLKPGGHLLAFGGSRTFHRLACAIEDAGFEIRDQLLWIYGSGFPKSLDVSKAIDKAVGAEREVIGSQPFPGKQLQEMSSPYKNNWTGIKYGSPATPAAIQWQGWGTALKPAHEPICMARKPFSGTVADNVQKYGTGAINIDAGRVGDFVPTQASALCWGEHYGNRKELSIPNTSGRWPSNVLLSETAAQDLDESTGESKSTISNRGLQHSGRHGGISDGGNIKLGTDTIRGHCDSGGASRFFYVAKASKREREAGLDGFDRVGLDGVSQNKYMGVDSAGVRDTSGRSNHHPTVKPIKLMEYLVKLVTPPGGTVLDPFTGSGSTGCACARLGFEFQGIELSPQYAAIAEARIKWFAMNELDLDELDRSENAKADTQGKLF